MHSCLCNHSTIHSSMDAHLRPYHAHASGPRQHALHIPEIVAMIVASLLDADLKDSSLRPGTLAVLYCRGVCRSWRVIFSPHLKLHAFYVHPLYPERRQAFEERLETLGGFVCQLRQVLPQSGGDLRRIRRTCPGLRKVGFVLRKEDWSVSTLASVSASASASASASVSSVGSLWAWSRSSSSSVATATTAIEAATHPPHGIAEDGLGGFLKGMKDLEEVEIYAQSDRLAIEMLCCMTMASTSTGSDDHLVDISPVQEEPTGSSSPSSTLTSLTVSSGFKRFKVENMMHTLRFASIPWMYFDTFLRHSPQLEGLVITQTALLTDLEAKREADRAHARARDLGVRDANLEEYRRPVWSRILFSLENWHRWNRFLKTMGMSGRDRSSSISVSSFFSSTLPLPSSSSSSSFSTSPGSHPPPFMNLQSLELRGVSLSGELLSSILIRCPRLKVLVLSLTGTVIETESCSDWLKSCPRLENVTIEGTCMKILLVEFWKRAPETLEAFTVRSVLITDAWNPLQPPLGIGTGSLTGPLEGQGVERLNLEGAKNSFGEFPGWNLTRLDLSLLGQNVGHCGVKYVMASCRSLKELVLGIRYFFDITADTTTTPPSVAAVRAGKGQFPKWACGSSLVSLQLLGTWRGDDLRMDQENLVGFIQRLKDLIRLQTLILPGKLLSDLSECRHEAYWGFGEQLDRLEHWLLQQEKDDLRATVAVSSTTGVMLDSCMEATKSRLANGGRGSSLEGIYFEEFPLADTDATGGFKTRIDVDELAMEGYLLFLPRMSPSLREIQLMTPMEVGRYGDEASGRRTTRALEMRLLHILMAATFQHRASSPGGGRGGREPGGSGLRRIWIQEGLLEVAEKKAVFQVVRKRFLNLYGHRNVDLCLLGAEPCKT